MAIYHLSPPAASGQALQEAAARLPHAHAKIAALLQRAAGSPAEHLPLPIYAIGLQALAGTEGLCHAESVGWLYLPPDQRYVAIEVQQRQAGDKHIFAAVHRSHLIERLRQLLANPAVQQSDGNTPYHPAVLRSYALYTFALWLRAANAPDSRLIVVPPAPPQLRPWPTSYSIEQFQTALRAEATRQLAFNPAINSNSLEG